MIENSATPPNIFGFDYSTPQGLSYNNLNSVSEDFKNSLTEILSDLYTNHHSPNIFKTIKSTWDGMYGRGNLEGLIDEETGLIFNKFIDLNSDNKVLYRMYVSYEDPSGFRDDDENLILKDREWYQIHGKIKVTGDEIELASQPIITKVNGYRRITKDFDKYTEQEQIRKLYEFVKPDYFSDRAN